MKVITIGRLKGNDVIIENDDKVSRHHLQIVQMDDGSFHLIDFGSTNGTYINGNRVESEAILTEDDFVRIGDTMLPWTTYFAPDFVSQAQEGFEDPGPTQQETGKRKMPGWAIALIVVGAVSVALGSIISICLTLF